MTRKTVALAACGVLLWLSAGRLLADDEKGTTKCGGETKATCGAAGSQDVALKCPVSGDSISRQAAVDYKGGKVYFCCPGCIPKFQENAAKYQSKANQQLVLSGQFKQVACPLSGGKVNETVKTKVCGAEVSFCCRNCQSKVANAEADKQLDMVFGKGFDKAFALVKQNKESE